MSLKVLIILGHPRLDSFCGALAEAYAQGAQQAGAEVRHLTLADLSFDVDVHTHAPQEQLQEPDVLLARELLSWADHSSVEPRQHTGFAFWGQTNLMR